MPSPHGEGRSAGAGTLLLGVLAVLFAPRRDRRRGSADVPRTPAAAGKTSAPRLRRSVVLAAFAVAAIVPAAIYGAYQYKFAAQARAAAIALTGGDPDRAPQLMVRFGCGGCHRIDGVPGANGRVGPPLNGLSQRVYIAGVATNDADRLIQWIVDPHSIDPMTAMPATGISPDEARHVAAYLYTLQ